MFFLFFFLLTKKLTVQISPRTMNNIVWGLIMFSSTEHGNSSHVSLAEHQLKKKYEIIPPPSTLMRFSSWFLWLWHFCIWNAISYDLFACKNLLKTIISAIETMNVFNLLYQKKAPIFYIEFYWKFILVSAKSLYLSSPE